MHKLVAVMFLMTSTMAFANQGGKRLECDFNFNDAKLGRVECDVRVEFDYDRVLSEEPRNGGDVEMRVSCRDSDSSVFRLHDRDSDVFFGNNKFLFVGRDNGDTAELLVKKHNGGPDMADDRGGNHDNAKLRLNGGDWIEGECDFRHGGPSN